MRQRHERLAAPCPRDPDIVLHHRVAAAEPMLVAQRFKNPLRRMPLLHRTSPVRLQDCGFRREAGRHSNQSRPVFGTEDYLLGQQLWHQSPRHERGHFDAGKEKADQETIETDAAACRKRDDSREIAVVLRIARSTVQDNLQRAAAVGLSWPLPGELTDDALEHKLFSRNGVKQGTRRRTEPNWADLAVELKKPGVTLLILWEEYRGSHPDGYGYSRFCELLRGFKQRLSPTMRQEHAAGDKVFVDYSGKKIPIVDRKTGEIREAEIFVAVLGASSYTFAEATWTQTLPDWIGSHVRMFRFFHGVPRLVVPDNLKSGVSRASFYDPEINRSYGMMASHYGVGVLPARPRKPRDKANVS